MRTPTLRSCKLLLCSQASCWAPLGIVRVAAPKAPFQMPPPPVTGVRAVAHDVPGVSRRNRVRKAVHSNPSPRCRKFLAASPNGFSKDGAQLKKDQLLFYHRSASLPGATRTPPRRNSRRAVRPWISPIRSSRCTPALPTRARFRSSISKRRKIPSSLMRRRCRPRKLPLKMRVSISNIATFGRPSDGRAGARLVDVGNVVQANTTSLLLIQKLDPIYADFTITEGELPERSPPDGSRRTQSSRPHSTLTRTTAVALAISLSSTVPCKTAAAP